MINVQEKTLIDMGDLGRKFDALIEIELFKIKLSVRGSATGEKLYQELVKSIKSSISH